MVDQLPTGPLYLSLALLPMVLLLVLLVFRRWKAGEAGAVGTLCALIIAALAFKAPLPDLAVASAKGAWDSVYILYVIWPTLHTRARPYHPMTQGKIERWHRSLKNQILVDNYYLPGQLERRVGQFVTYYNTRRYHESLNNLTPEDVYRGRGQAILTERDKIKRATMQTRRALHRHAMAA